MVLFAVRRKFIQLSGREDLASAVDGRKYEEDNGADFFIRGGSIDLDLEQDHLMTCAEHQESLTAGDYDIQLDWCRNVQACWYTDADDEKYKLDKYTYGEMIDAYPELGNTDQATPEYWCQYTTRRVPDQVDSGRDIDVVSLLVLPPTDESITLHVYGKWHAYSLTENGDENFWSVNYPNLLVLAALRNMEGFYRNTKGYDDYDKIIQRTLHGLDKDYVEWDCADGVQMEG